MRRRREEDRGRLRAGVTAVLATALFACGEEPLPSEQRQEDAIELVGPAGDARLELLHVRPEEVRLGQEFRYSLRLENVTDEPVEGVVLRQVSPAGFELLESTVRSGDERPEDAERSEGPREGAPVAPAEASASRERVPASGRGAHELRWELGTLAPGASKVVEAVGLVHREGEQEVCLLVQFDAPACLTWNVVDPELQVERRVEDHYWACQDVAVVYRVANSGSGTSDPARVFDDLPPGLRTKAGDNRVVLEVGALAPGESAEETVELTAEHVGVFHSRPRLQIGERTVQGPSSVVRVVRPELALDVRAPERQPFGVPVELEVSLSNRGDVPAVDAVVELVASENASDVRAREEGVRGSGERFELGTLAPGASRAFHLTLEPEEIGSVSVRLRAGAECADTEAADLTREVATRIVGVPAVRLEVVDEKDPIAVGEVTTYSIEVKNQGTGEDLGLRLSAVLGPGLEPVGGEGETEVSVSAGSLRIAPLTRLEPGKTATWRIQGRALTAGQTGLTVRLQSDASPSPVHEEEPTTVIQ